MPSWTEKPHDVPMTNVNLKPCGCTGSADNCCTCGAKPLLLPCPLPPSVTFQVVLGECGCGYELGQPVVHNPNPLMMGHSPACPARPVEVSCSISGKTWEESEVGDCEYRHENVPEGHARVEHIAAAHWALVKALVLGQPQAQRDARWVEGPTDLFTQRDAVFAAIADMARAEEVLSAKANVVFTACRRPERLPSRDDDECSPSANLLRVYVGYLIESVSVPP